MSLLAELEALAAVDDWMAEAVCSQTDAEVFFPVKGASPRRAKHVCRSCDVRERCLQYALDNNIGFGVWGGLTTRERRQIRPTSSGA